MTRVYSAGQVHAALPWERLAQALEAAFISGANVPLRHAHALSAEDTLLLMPAWNPDVIVLKLVTVIAAVASTVQACVLVADRRSGQPLAVLDGAALTLRRTAATSALAARHLARPDARTLLLVGTGRLAAWMARAHAALRPRAAARGADIICCATTSTEPLVRDTWLSEGTHLDLVGGFKPEMRDGALKKAGDLVQPLQRGLIRREHVLCELAGLLRHELQVRTGPRDVTLFKSVGTGLEDLAAAQLVVAAP